MLAYFLRFRRRVRKPWKSTFSITPLSFDASSPRSYREYPHKPYSVYCRKLQSLRYIFSADSMSLSSFKLWWMAPKTHVFWNRVRNGRSRSFKVIDYGSHRKRVCTFVLVINSNVGPILPHLKDIAGFLCWEERPTPIPPEFWGVPLGLDCRCCGPEERTP